MTKYNKLVKIIAVIFTVLYIIGILLLIVLASLRKIDLFSLFISLLSGAIQIILLWALNSALERIEALENILMRKGVVKSDDYSQELNKPTDKITFCKNCGFQLFEEDVVCPNCNTPAGKTNAKKATDNVVKAHNSDNVSGEIVGFCKVCGYQLFPEDKECPNCKTPVNSKNENKK